MAWDDDLVGVHRDIAACNHKRVSVLAGPGTGKTTYAMLRSVQRVLEEGADPERVLVISYTRTAANDLRNKLQADRDESVNQVRATTLHAFAFGLLQSESAFSAIGRTRRVLLDHEQETLIHDLGGEFGGYRERKRLLNELLSGWDDGSRLHPCHTDVPTERDFERAVLQWLREHKAMLVGEVVSMAYSHFESSPWSDIFTQFDHIYVDEYQDLNGVEQKFVNLIADRCEATLMIVGDDDQSIYGFRNANPEGILRFHSNDEVTPFELSVCGRCPKNFVELADYLINHAPNRSKGPLRAKDPSEGILKRYQWPSLEQEIEGIASEVAEEVSNGEMAPGQVLVLCNRRMVGKAIRDALVRRGVLAESFYGQEPLEKRATQERFSWLQLLADPNDVVALRIAVSSIQGDRRKNMWQSLRSIARSESDGILGALERLVQGDLQTNTSTRHLVNLVVELRERIDQLASLELPELVLELFPEENEDFDEMRDIALQAVEVSESASELVNHCRDNGSP